MFSRSKSLMVSL